MDHLYFITQAAENYIAIYWLVAELQCQRRDCVLFAVVFFAPIERSISPTTSRTSRLLVYIVRPSGSPTCRRTLNHRETIGSKGTKLAIG